MTETGWEAVIDALAELHDAHVTLLHVVGEDVIEEPSAAFVGLLGRRHRPGLEARLAGLAGAAAEALLDDAAERLGAPAQRVIRRGRIEHEVLAATDDADVLVIARDTLETGPRSIGHAVRFVVDHAPCQVLLVWPGQPQPHDRPPPPRAYGGPPPPKPHGGHPPTRRTAAARPRRPGRYGDLYRRGGPP